MIPRALRRNFFSDVQKKKFIELYDLKVYKPFYYMIRALDECIDNYLVSL
jgi:hypothetical protein